MKRRTWLGCAAALAACGKRQAELEVFPPSLGGWTRISVRDIPVAEAPDAVPQASLRRVQTAAYEGSGKVEVRAYEMATPEAGLDAAQRWRASADTVVFWARRYFVVVTWRDADRSALRRFTQALEKRLNGA